MSRFPINGDMTEDVRLMLSPESPLALAMLAPGLIESVDEARRSISEADAGRREQAQSALQQGAHALRFIGEAALARIVDEMSHVCSAAVSQAVPQVDSQVDSDADSEADSDGHKKVFEKACQALKHYLVAVADGVLMHPLALFEIYKEMRNLHVDQKAAKAHPADLVFTDNVQACRLQFPDAISSPPDPTGTVTPISRRARFERGLLSVLRSADVDSVRQHLTAMQVVLQEIAGEAQTISARNFWLALDAAVGVLMSCGQIGGCYAKQFFGQINLRLRRLVEGHDDIALGEQTATHEKRLLRDALFFIASAPAGDMRGDAIKRANDLPDLQDEHYRDACESVARPASGRDDEFSRAIDQLQAALTRTEALLERAIEHGGRPLELDDAAAILTQALSIADAFGQKEISDFLARCAEDVRKLQQGKDGNAIDDQTIARLSDTLAAVSLSLPLLRHMPAMAMPYTGLASASRHRAGDAAAPEAGGNDPDTSPRSPAASSAEKIDEEDIDRELLEVFLMEADELLATISTMLDALRKEPANMAHVTVLRRSFHTLKGSGRIVGLSALGDAAMVVEGFLNDWLAQARSANSTDFALLDQAAREISGWLEEIKDNGRSSRDPDGLIAMFDRARDDAAFREEEGIAEAVSTTSATEETSATHEAQDAEEAGEVTAAKDATTIATTDLPAGQCRVGDLILPEKLHQIYSAESAQLLQTLAEHLGRWQQHAPDMVVPEVARATHSLKSSSASVRFAALLAVAQPLDEVMKFLRNYPELLDAFACGTLMRTVQALQDMQRQFADHVMPSARDDLAQDLRALLTALEERRRQESSAAKPDSRLAEPIVQNDEIEPELLEIFLEEGRDLLPQIGESLHKLQKHPEDKALIQYLLRPLHTIKGSARMAGAMQLGQHMHELESRIDEMARDGSPSAAMVDELLVRYDRGVQLFDALQSPAATGATTVNAVMAVAPPVENLAVPEPDEQKTPGATPLVRLRAGILDNLLNQAGEISISRSGLESNVNLLRQHLADLGGNVARLGTQLREVEIQAEIQIAASNQRLPQNQHFDPLEFDRFTHLQELTRMLAESVNDVASLQKNLADAVDQTQNSLVQQARLTREMQQELMHARMVQFNVVEARLHRLVRQTAKDTGKELELEIVGSAVELDRSILEKMVGPFEHLMRNAVAHGIESVEQRLAAGKKAAGKLRLEVRQEGNEAMIRLSDDGRGLDLAGIRDKAVRLDLIEADEQLSDADLTGFIFHPGFSTSRDVTALAGRGVGMDVVRSEVASLGGRISINTTSGRGATFIIHLPLSLAIAQVVLLELGEQIYAIPSLLVEHVRQLKAAEQDLVFQDGTLEWQGRRLPVHSLSALLGERQGVRVQNTLPVMVVKNGNDFLAILVDRVIGNREVVTKNIGPQLAHMVGVVGATVLGSGSIVLILNPVQLAQRSGYQRMLRHAEPEIPDDDIGKKTVLVVDDSLTVRRVMQRLLTREGYRVVQATDGVDALQQLQTLQPDIVLLDIEMPRMDGFDLARNLRDMESTASLPIIMITSRTAAKHRERAMELGVNEYLGKPYQDAVLLKMMRGLIESNGTRPAFCVDEVLFPQPVESVKPVSGVEQGEA